MLKQPLPSRIRLRCGATMVGGVALAVSAVLWAAQPSASPPPPIAAVAAPSLPALPAREQAAAAVMREPSAVPDVRHTERGWMPAPKYPPDALANKIDGRVRLHLLVAPDGSVKDVRVVESEPQGVFDAVSIEAAKTWRLDPPRRDGKPVEGWLQVPIAFEHRRQTQSGGGSPIDVRMRIDSPGQQTTSPRVVARDGEPFSVRQGEGAAALTLEMTATRQTDDRIALAGTILRGTEVIARPRLVLSDGVPGSVRVADAEGRDAFVVQLDVSAQPERYRDVLAQAANR